MRMRRATGWLNCLKGLCAGFKRCVVKLRVARLSGATSEALETARCWPNTGRFPETRLPASYAVWRWTLWVRHTM